MALQFRLRHTMLPVADLDRSVDFYTRLLGMRLLRSRIDKQRGQSTAYVGYDDEAAATVLELVASSGKEARWGGHISVAVSDLSLLCQQLDGEGVRFKKRLPVASEERRMAIALDPDSFEVELTEL